MALTATINLNPTPLSDSGVWFANAAAFNAYMQGISGLATISPGTTTVYVPLNYNESLEPAVINIDGTEYALVTVAMLISLKEKLNNLDASYQLLRTQLKTAGIIDKAQ